MSRVIIIHLEDKVSLRNILRDQIEHVSSNVELGQFETGERLLQTLERNNAPRVDCFLIDIRLDGQLDGYAVAEAIRTMGYDAPIIITSGFGKVNREWLDDWQCGWVEKPIDTARLQREILPQANRYHNQVKAQNSASRHQNG